MKRADVLAALRGIAKERGVDIEVTEGSRHSKVRIGTRIVIVPRHREINEHTAKAILQHARED